MTKIGEYTYGKPEVLTFGKDGDLTIGKYCSIGPEVKILLGGEHETEKITNFPFFAYFKEAFGLGDYRTKGDVTIGNDVWIGYGVTILSGVTIGDAAVIGAGAVVARDVLPYEVVIGNPLQTLRFKFTEIQREALLRIRWWDWPREKIVEAAPLICSSRIEEFITKYEQT